MKLKFYLVLLVAILLQSCGGKPKRNLTFYDTEPNAEFATFAYTDGNNSDYEQMTNADIIPIKFSEKGGVKFVNVSVNGFGFEMIFDTGCSSTLISVAEANYLCQKGYLSQEDILGTSETRIADGSIVEDMVVNLKEVILDNKIRCSNVIATVSANNNAPLLLGNEVLNRVAAYVVDNENQEILFKLK